MLLGRTLIRLDFVRHSIATTGLAARVSTHARLRLCRSVASRIAPSAAGRAGNPSGLVGWDTPICQPRATRPPAGIAKTVTSAKRDTIARKSRTVSAEPHPQRDVFSRAPRNTRPLRPNAAAANLPAYGASSPTVFARSRGLKATLSCPFSRIHYGKECHPGCTFAAVACNSTPPFHKSRHRSFVARRHQLVFD